VGRGERTRVWCKILCLLCERKGRNSDKVTVRGSSVGVFYLHSAGTGVESTEKGEGGEEGKESGSLTSLSHQKT